MSDLLKSALLASVVLKNNKPSHYGCEDKWYSCPMHEDGCYDENAGKECNCGADEINKEFDKAIIALDSAIAKAKGKHK